MGFFLSMIKDLIMNLISNWMTFMKITQIVMMNQKWLKFSSKVLFRKCPVTIDLKDLPMLKNWKLKV